MMEQLKTGVELIEVEEGHRMEEEADHRRSDGGVTRQVRRWERRVRRLRRRGIYGGAEKEASGYKE